MLCVGLWDLMVFSGSSFSLQLRKELPLTIPQSPGLESAYTQLLQLHRGHHSTLECSDCVFLEENEINTYHCNLYLEGATSTSFNHGLDQTSITSSLCFWCVLNAYLSKFKAILVSRLQILHFGDLSTSYVFEQCFASGITTSYFALGKICSLLCMLCPRAVAQRTECCRCTSKTKYTIQVEDQHLTGFRLAFISNPSTVVPLGEMPSNVTALIGAWIFATCLPTRQALANQLNHTVGMTFGR